MVVQDGVLSQELVHSGLSDLGRTGDGMKMSYLTLSLSVSLDEFIDYIMCMLNTLLLSLRLCMWHTQDYGLIDISLLSSYPHLQRLVLASNNLTGAYLYTCI